MIDSSSHLNPLLFIELYEGGALQGCRILGFLVSVRDLLWSVGADAPAVCL